MSYVLSFFRRLFRSRGADPLDGLDPARVRVVVGLGNPGPEYSDTRHNVGFMCVDELARRYSARWHHRADLRSLVATAQLGDLTLVLAKPQTFMNRSGKAVRALVDRLGVPHDCCLILYDDMDLPLGTLRMRERGSPGTHNGMRAVIAMLESDDLPRLRIGISQASPGGATSHVLSEFGPAQRKVVDELLGRAADAAVAWVMEGAATAMNRYNAVRS